jgi:hypothetical protein
MNETPKEKLTINDLVEAQRKTAEQLEAINENLQSIRHYSQSLANTDQQARGLGGWDGGLFILLLVGLIATGASKDNVAVFYFIAFELALVVFLLTKSLTKVPAVLRLQEFESINAMHKRWREEKFKVPPRHHGM